MLIVRLALSGLLLALAPLAHALEYRTTGRPALLYDAPSTAAGKVAIVGSGVPLEVVVDTQIWIKVRDHSGRLTWIEQSALNGTRSVMIKAASSAIRLQPRPDADIAFHAVRGVLLEATGDANTFGWLPVKHANGMTGWLPAHEAWGR
ncbi:MAG TPA: SH3 domain-containing protein [Thiobacillus sp.]